MGVSIVLAVQWCPMQSSKYSTQHTMDHTWYGAFMRPDKAIVLDDNAMLLASLGLLLCMYLSSNRLELKARQEAKV